MTYQQELGLIKKYRERVSKIAKKLENGYTIYFCVRSKWGVLITHNLIEIGALEIKSDCHIAQDIMIECTVKNIDCHRERLGKFITDMTSYIRVERKKSIRVVVNN